MLDWDTRELEGEGRTEELASRVVPGTDVVITIHVKRADPRLAKLLGDKPGTRLWIDQYTVVRHPGTVTFVNYLLCGRQTEMSAREEANFLWTDTVQRRDAHNRNNTECRLFPRPTN
jgi:hypothetical protein